MKPALTLEAFADWCEKQPKRKEYDGSDPWECALAQYARANGYSRSTANGEVKDDQDKQYRVAGVMRSVLVKCICDTPSTFGALATRLRTALSESVQP